ncbi:MAG: ribonuclease HIII [bacterium]
MKQVVANIESKLQRWRLASASGDDGPARTLANDIFKIVFRDQAYADIWDERVLLGLRQLMLAHPPNEAAYGQDIQAIRQRTERVCAIHDALYGILDPETRVEVAVDRLTECAPLSEHAKQRLQVESNLGELRATLEAPSEKLYTFLDHLAGAEQGASLPWFPEFRGCIEAIQERQGPGTVNALLVHRQTNTGIVLAVTAGVQHGSGQVRAITLAAATFASAVERARLALVSKSFLPASHDVLVTADLTEAEYSGGSVALAAAIAMYGSAGGCYVDPYTAFTGDINFRDGEWFVQSVESIAEKIEAARQAGCRRVFLPQDNEPDVPPELRRDLRLVFVGSIGEVLQALFLPTHGPKVDTIEAKKTYLLRQACTERGWHLSGPSSIQDGLQFTLSPPSPPELKVNIYRTGAHSPKQSDRPEFQHILDALSALDLPSVVSRTVQQTFTIKDVELRKRIRNGLEKLIPAGSKAEQYCDYSFSFEEGKEHLAVKQYASGKLQVQGYAGLLYKRVLDVIIPTYNLRYPSAALNVADYISVPSAGAKAAMVPRTFMAEEAMPFPHIGTDESGKGDYFGPMVVAGVWLDEVTQKKLEVLGVRDSKTLSDDKCRRLAVEIRALCAGKYEEVEISPERYNMLYEQFQRENKKLNHLLAWGHARALESLLSRHASDHAVADQFGDEKYIKSKLMEKGKTVQLVQTAKAERYIAVAAASILARDRFLLRLQQIGRQFGVVLPKGASPEVIQAGRELVEKGGVVVLRRVAKLHFKTTSLILEQRGGK